MSGKVRPGAESVALVAGAGFAPFGTATPLHCPAVVLLGRQHGLAASQRCEGASWYESALRGSPPIVDAIDDPAGGHEMMQSVARVG